LALRLARKDAVLVAEQQPSSKVHRQEQPWPRRLAWKQRWMASSLWLPATGFEPAWLQLWVFPTLPKGEAKEPLAGWYKGGHRSLLAARQNLAMGCLVVHPTSG